jgi:putative ABC transport system permease protein
VKKDNTTPPKLFLRFFRWFCHPELKNYIEGDLMELYEEQVNEYGERKADVKFIVDVLLLFRPGIIRPSHAMNSINSYDMFRNYLKVALRNTLKDKAYSLINIGGLAVGMTVTSLIGLWMYDELSMNKYHQNYASIAQVMQHTSVDGGIATFSTLPMPTAAAIRTTYGEDFKYVASTGTGEQIIAGNDKVFTKTGCFTESSFPEILTLEMVHGTRAALQDPSALLLSESLAKAIFGDADAINQEVKMNNASTLVVKGVYKDLPRNSSFHDLAFMAPIKLLFSTGRSADNWYSSSFQIYAQLNPKSDFEKSSEKIKNILYENTKDATKPLLFLNPMSRWHLYDFKEGKSVNGRIQFVWMFGIVGGFVLFLACINFMNLSTARAEKRGKEVGIRKAIGSQKKQLINQFLSESLLVVTLAFILTAGLTTISLPWFNELSGKQMTIPFTNPLLWLIIIGSVITISILAGSYPAFYLSSFQPIRILKGTFKAGRFASVPRKVLVVVQFTVSVVLIIGTIIVYNQIQYAKDRPVGYSRDGLITIPLITNEIQQQFEPFRQDLLKANEISGISLSSSPMTGIWSSADNLEWKGKDPNSQFLFGTISIDPDFGNVVEWKIKEGRNFSRELSTDSQAFIFNKAAILQMGLKEPIGEIIKWHGKNWNIIGVVDDMVMTSPFVTAMPTVFMMDNRQRPFNVVNIKLNTKKGTSEAVSKVEAIFKKYAPATPFNYKFADQEYALKFAAEERIGKLAGFFGILAVFISCLGLFGLASFTAEQRTKEIGIRKVLGASVSELWRMLSFDFIVLVIVACLVAVPIAYFFSQNWLLQYEYRTAISWWIFGSAILGAIAITLLTVSFQAVKAALANPVKSLRSE